MAYDNYKMGWLVVFFDLPTTTPEDKKTISISVRLF